MIKGSSRARNGSSTSSVVVIAAIAVTTAKIKATGNQKEERLLTVVTGREL